MPCVEKNIQGPFPGLLLIDKDFAVSEYIGIVPINVKFSNIAFMSGDWITDIRHHMSGHNTDLCCAQAGPDRCHRHLERSARTLTSARHQQVQ